MDKWITLHTLSGNKEMPFNTNLIETMHLESNGTRLYFGENDYWDVRESPSEILAKLTQPDTELRHAARELIDLLDCEAVAQALNTQHPVTYAKLHLKTLLEKP